MKNILHTLAFNQSNRTFSRQIKNKKKTKKKSNRPIAPFSGQIQNNTNTYNKAHFPSFFFFFDPAKVTVTTYKHPKICCSNSDPIRSLAQFIGCLRILKCSTSLFPQLFFQEFFQQLETT